MTKIRYSDKGGRFYIRAEGHATGSVKGCAAISGLVYALVGYLQNAEYDESPQSLCDSSPCTSREAFKVDLSDGFFEVEFCGGDDARAVYLMTVIGLLQVAKAEQDVVEIEKGSSGD